MNRTILQTLRNKGIKTEIQNGQMGTGGYNTEVEYWLPGLRGALSYKEGISKVLSNPLTELEMANTKCFQNRNKYCFDSTGYLLCFTVCCYDTKTISNYSKQFL